MAEYQKGPGGLGPLTIALILAAIILIGGGLVWLTGSGPWGAPPAVETPQGR